MGRKWEIFLRIIEKHKTLITIIIAILSLLVAIFGSKNYLENSKYSQNTENFSIRNSGENINSAGFVNGDQNFYINDSDPLVTETEDNLISDACLEPDLIMDDYLPVDPYVFPDEKSDSTLVATLSSETPESLDVPQGAVNVPFLALDLINDNDEDINIQRMSFFISGNGYQNAVKQVRVFDGLIPRGYSSSFNEKGFTIIDMRNDPIVVSANTTKTVVVAENLRIGCAGHKIGIELISTYAIEANTGRSVNINYDKEKAIKSPEFEILPNVAPAILYAENSLDIKTVEVGDKDVVLGSFNLRSQFEPILLQAILIRPVQSKANFSGNIYMKLGDKTTNKVFFDSNIHNYIVFDMTNNEEEGWILEMNKDYEISIRGDVLGSDRNNAIYFPIEPDGMISAGLRLGFGARLIYKTKEGGTSDEYIHDIENEVAID